MKAKKSILLSTVAALTLLISGCGDTASTPVTDVETPASTSNIVTVERGPILGATVTDANGSVAIELGSGQYSFEKTIAYPVTSTGGYIDVNRNSQVDAGEVKNMLILKSSEGNVVTLATTVASNDELKGYLVDTLEINETILYEKTPGDDQRIEAFSDEMFKYAYEYNIRDLSTVTIEDMKLIKNEYESRYYEYQNDDLNPAEHEQNLMDHEMNITVMDDGDAEEVHVEVEIEVGDNNQSFTGNIAHSMDDN